MIVSVTARTSMDHILFIPSFKLNATLRATRTLNSMGGKSTNASWVLAELGDPVLALGFAAGHVGQQIVAMLQERGVTVDFTWVEGESRRNIAIICEDGSGQTSITPRTLQVNPEHITRLFEKYDAALAQATIVLSGGSLPPGVTPEFYRNLVSRARQRDIPVVLDAAGDNLRAGLEAGATYIKPNHEELSALIGESVETDAAAYHAARQIYEQYGAASIVTLGAKGALAVLPDRAYRIPALPVKVVNNLGAGDSVAAGITASVHRGLPVEEGLRLGIAAAAAVLQTPRTADCDRAEVERLAQQVQLIPYMPEDASR